MSQLDVAISFSQFMVFLVCFYVFYPMVYMLVMQCWYTRKLSVMQRKSFTLRDCFKLENTVILKKMFSG